MKHVGPFHVGPLEIVELTDLVDVGQDEGGRRYLVGVLLCYHLLQERWNVFLPHFFSFGLSLQTR